MVASTSPRSSIPGMVSTGEDRKSPQEFEIKLPSKNKIRKIQNIMDEISYL